jgi:hypothetical protein
MPETLRIDLRPFFAKFAETPAALKSTLPAPTAAVKSTPPSSPAAPQAAPLTGGDHVNYWATIPGNKMQSLPDGSPTLRVDAMNEANLPPEILELKNTAKSKNVPAQQPAPNPVVANTATPQPGQSAAQPNTTTNSPPLASQAATQPGVNGQKSPAQQPPVAAPAAPVAPAAPAGPYDHAKTMAVLQDPKTPPEERHASGRAFAQHLMATNAVKPEDTAAARAMAEGNFTPESEAWLNQASDRFKQESATQNPSLLSSPKGYGQLVGMWDALGPMGQLAFGVGVPAAMISLLGGGGVMSLLGGLGIVGAGLGAAGTGMLGDTAQAEAGRFMGNMGNFLGAIPNEARNANIFDPNSASSKDFENKVRNTYMTWGQGQAEAQKLIDQQTAQFAPLEKMYQMHPGFAHSMLMGMENGPKTREEAEALYQQVSGRVNAARQPDFLANKAREAARQAAADGFDNAGKAIAGGVNNAGTWITKQLGW